MYPYSPFQDGDSSSDRIGKRSESTSSNISKVTFKYIFVDGGHQNIDFDLSQAQRLKKLAQEGHFSYDVAFAVMGEEKKDELDKVVIKNDTLRKYFPRSYTPKQMEDTIIKLLDQWQRKQQRQNER